jgi:anion-transporting  ArsA/GET3 family ATPase
VSGRWLDRRILLLGGPGGVGKTTLAAALGVHFARSGKRTVVLTVDPARRLAQALGFQGFDSELQKVAVPDAPGAELFATMLDTQRYLDKVMARFAKSEEQRQKILNNPLYRTTTETMGGTQEYAAMERLLEFAQDPKWDKIIVDTPPTSNAVDLLSAPQRLASFMDSSVLKWFQGEKPGYLGFFKRGTKLAMKFLEKVFGAEFLGSFSRFMDDLEGMHAGFRDRNLEVVSLLQSEQTAFLLVTYPSETRFQECVSFLDTLNERRIPLAGLVLNRVEPQFPTSWDGAADEQSRYRVSQILGFYASLHAAQKVWIERFESVLPGLPAYHVPRRTGQLHDLPALARLAELLVQ